MKVVVQHAVQVRQDLAGLAAQGAVADDHVRAQGVQAADPMEVQGTVWVISPQDGDEVGSTFTVEGRGAFFEANVSWQLLRGSEPVAEGFATAEEGMTLSPYRFEVIEGVGHWIAG